MAKINGVTIEKITNKSNNFAMLIVYVWTAVLVWPNLLGRLGIYQGIKWNDLDTVYYWWPAGYKIKDKTSCTHFGKLYSLQHAKTIVIFCCYGVCITTHQRYPNWNSSKRGLNQINKNKNSREMCYLSKIRILESILQSNASKISRNKCSISIHWW